MKLVIAHAGDAIAGRLAVACGARLVAPRELSTRGWRHFPVGGGDDAIGLVDGAVPASALRGVLTRIGAVTAADLPHIAVDDRDYVAAEMTAFLQSFLLSLRCPVINRPTSSSLMGPGWSAARWRAAAIAAGLRVADDSPVHHDVTILGAKCFGPVELAPVARVLARCADVELLSARFTVDGAFVAANPWADLPDDALVVLSGRLS